MTPEETNDDPLRAGDLDAALQWVKQARIAARTKPDRRVGYLRSRHRALDGMIAVLFARTLEMRRELEALKAKSATASYRGVWDSGHDYEPGDSTTFKGALWVARIKSRGMKPGDGGLGWKLAVKSGRAG